MIDIQFDERAVRKSLDRLQRRLDDLSPVMKAIATALEAGRRSVLRPPASRPAG